MNRTLLVLAACALTIAAAQAADLGYHPALGQKRPVASGIDPSTFIPGHPARGATGQAPAREAAVAQAPASAAQAH